MQLQTFTSQQVTPAIFIYPMIRMEDAESLLECCTARLAGGTYRK